jgi:hypothetical protein
MHILDKKNNRMVLDGILYMEQHHLTLHLKIAFLKQFLLSDASKIPERFGPPRRRSFFEYIGDARDKNKIACVLGQ